MMLLLGAGTALGSPGTLRLLNVAPTLGHRVTVTAPGGEVFSIDPGRALVRVTPAGGAAVETHAWCVLPRRGISGGVDYSVDLQTPAGTPELGTPALQEAAWIMTRADGLIALATDPGREAAAIQVAVWQLTGRAADITAVTGDTALNARIAALRMRAHGRSAATSIELRVAPGAVTAGTPVNVTVAGTPGAQVALEVTSGVADLSATTVVVGVDGTATVRVTPSGTVPVELTAVAEGGVLWRAVHPSGRSQDMAWVVPATVRATATIPVAAAPAPTPEVPSVPVVVPTNTPPGPGPAAVRPAVLHLVKSAPARVLSGLTIPYTLTVTNVSGRTAREVVLRDPLPAGTVLVRVPLRARMSAGVVVWRLGDLAPRASVTLRMRLRTLPSLRSPVRNAAQASAANAATVRARAITRILPLPPGAQPAVTG